MGAALRIEGLTLRFGGVTALDGLSLSLAPCTVLGLAGPNGSGKSSLINALTGHHPCDGTIYLGTRRIDRLSPADRARLGITRTFQSPRAYRRMSVLENLQAARHAQMPLFRLPASRRRDMAQLRETLSRFGLSARADALPDSLTPFELRLLELARAAISGARLLLLDEPAAGATEAEVAQISHLLAQYLIPERTVILIEHRLDLLAERCSEILVLQAGRVLAQGAPAQVFDQPSVRDCLMGEPAHA